jgi:hypothetical protein
MSPVIKYEIMGGMIRMSRKQMTRYEMLQKAICGVTTVKEAAEALGMSERQAKRLKKGVEEKGAGPLIHGNGGRTPKNAISAETKEEIDPGIPINDTQFGRCLNELGIQLTAARSPRAKGRAERLWGTLQSRLPVEFASRGITDVDAANEFLCRYIYVYNSQFAVEPEDAENVFSELPEGVSPGRILCVKEKRAVDAGGVFSYGGKQFKVLEDARTGFLPPGAAVDVLTGPATGMKVRYRKTVYGVVPFTQPEAPRAAKPEARPKAPAPVPDSRPYKRGGYMGEYDASCIETDAEVMDMLYDIFSIEASKVPEAWL